MFVWKHNRHRCNPYVQYIDENNNVHPQVPRHLYEEIPEPAVPDGYDRDLWISMEQESAPYVTYTKRSDEQVTNILINRYTINVQQLLDSRAQELGYDDIKSAVGYADEPAVPKFQEEGKLLRAWRSLVWDKFYEIIDVVKARTREMPTWGELEAELPKCGITTNFGDINN